MKLTPENKKHIDNLDYNSLLYGWRHAPVGDIWFEGETGIYWGERMRELRDRPETDHVAISQSIGWKKK